jgi:hypothetical protein
MSDSGKRYNDREVALILRMAADLEAQPGRSVTPHAGGRTRAEIEDIAAAAGIAPGAVHAAFDAWLAEAGGTLSGIVGGATVLRIERHITGELSDDAMVELIDRGRWNLGTRTGDVTQQPGVVRWIQATAEGPSTEVELARRDGNTRVRIFANHENSAGWSLLAAGGTSVLLTALFIVAAEPPVPAVLALFAGSAGAAALTVRVLWRRSVARTKQRLLKLMDQLETGARSLVDHTSRSE